MKHLLLTLALAATAAFAAQAQSVVMATDLTEICIYNESTEAFEDCQSLQEESTFTLNHDETLFRHTTPDMTSYYQVKTRQFNAEDKSWQYAVVSDVGNSYVFIVMPKTNLIKIVGTRRNGQGNKEYYMVAHRIAQTWREEEAVGLTKQIN